MLYPNPDITVDGPPVVNVALRNTKDGDLSVHLLNVSASPETEKRSITDYVPPLYDITVKVKLDKKPTSVSFIQEDSKIKWDYKNGVLTANIPKLDIYGILVIK